MHQTAARKELSENNWAKATPLVHDARRRHRYPPRRHAFTRGGLAHIRTFDHLTFPHQTGVAVQDGLLGAPGTAYSTLTKSRSR